MLMAVSGTAALTPFLSACQALGILPSAATGTPSITPTGTAISTLTETPLPTATPDPRTPVVFVKTRDRAEGVRRALELWGQNPVLGKTVALKANFNSANPSPASTHPDTLRALVQQLWSWGAVSITLPERSGSAGTRSALTELGIFDLADELGVEVAVLDEFRDPANWMYFQPSGSHWPAGFYISNLFLQADAIVQTCCLKPHSLGAITLSLKNAVGMVARYLNGIGHDFMQELHSGEIGIKAAEINSVFSPSLVLLDGVEAFITGGPDTGQKVWGEVMLAGTDRVAIDAVGVAVLRHLGYTGRASHGPIFEQAQIARAAELGLGVNSPDKIRLVTGDAESEAYASQITARLLET